MTVTLAIVKCHSSRSASTTRASRVPPLFRLSIGLSVGLLTAPIVRLGAQAAVTASPALRVWAFGRGGRAWPSGQTPNNGVSLLSGTAGIAGSYGTLLGMVRATGNTDIRLVPDSTAPGMKDFAVLVGARSRGDTRFLAGAVGLAHATPGVSVSGTRMSSVLAPTFDLSVHAANRLAGCTGGLSGVLGSASTRYVAFTVGFELGRLGS